MLISCNIKTTIRLRKRAPIRIKLRAMPFQKGVQGGRTAEVWDIPKNIFSPLALLKAAREKKEKVSRGHPLDPAKGLPPLGT
jgi:hypothetical protein